jgi:hypothetical protein
MATDNLIGQVYERPGHETGEDHWEVVSIRRDEHGPLAVLRNSDGETATVLIAHLREPYWRPISSTDPPDASED